MRAHHRLHRTEALKVRHQLLRGERAAGARRQQAGARLQQAAETRRQAGLDLQLQTEGDRVLRELWQSVERQKFNSCGGGMPLRRRPSLPSYSCSLTQKRAPGGSG